MPATLSDLLLAMRPRTPHGVILELVADHVARIRPTRLITFHYVLRGQVAIASTARGRAEELLEPGDFALLLNGPPHQLRVGQPSQRCDIALSPQTGRPAREELRVERVGDGTGARVVSGIYGAVPPHRANAFAGLPELIVDRAPPGGSGPSVPLWGDLVALEAACTGLGAKASVFTMVHGFVVKIVRQSALAEMEFSPGGEQAAAAVLRARSLMDDAPAENWTMAELAKRVGLSRSNLFSAFRASTGSPPARYLASVRLQRAKALVLDSDLGVAEIAWQSGFRSPAAFARSFEREHGLTPQRLRASHRGTA